MVENLLNSHFSGQGKLLYSNFQGERWLGVSSTIQHRITLAFVGKRDHINSSILSATILNFQAVRFPKSFPQQCKRIKSGTGPTFPNDLICWRVLFNWSTLCQSHHSEMLCLSYVRSVPPGLITASENAFLISDQPYCLRSLNEINLNFGMRMYDDQEEDLQRPDFWISLVENSPTARSVHAPIGKKLDLIS